MKKLYHRYFKEMIPVEMTRVTLLIITILVFMQLVQSVVAIGNTLYDAFIR